ncbi:MAG: SCO family protein [Gammaproteobacteria bacterium]|nr:SCO family protein [Gammaproteobacteria bacterium]
MPDFFRYVRLPAVVVLWLCAAGVGAQPRDHADHAPAGSQSEFDNATALRISQAAIGNRLPDLAFTRSDGSRLTLSDLRGKPLVISMIYTSCYHICPTTTRHLAEVVAKARDALGPDSFRVLTIGFDVANDTPDGMRVFAAQQAVSQPGWDFLSASRETIDALAKELGFQYFPTAKGFDHLIQATVTDADGVIYRQVYGMQFQTPLLVEPLKDVVFGRTSEASLVTSIGHKVRLFCTVYDPSTDRYYFDYSIFIGMFIGLASTLLVVVFLVREWRRKRGR